MLTTNELYTVKKYNGETLDGYISKDGDESELSTIPKMIELFNMIKESNAKEIDKEIATLKSDIASLESYSKKQEKEIASLRTSCFTLTAMIASVQSQLEYLESEGKKRGEENEEMKVIFKTF